MGIRKPVVEDWEQISLLLNQLDYQDTEKFLKVKIEKLLKDINEELIVFEEDKKGDCYDFHSFYTSISQMEISQG